MKTDIDSIFYVLGNKTRRNILSILADEPMYFNQISKEIGTGQQAMLRHMKLLEDTGFVNSYGEKSKFGAPDRKYYNLDSSFNLSVTLSEDEFTINYSERDMSEDRRNRLSYKKFGQISSDPSLGLETIKNHLKEVDEEITNLQTEIDNLKEVRQALLHKMHQIGRDNLTFLERKIAYEMMRKDSSPIADLSKMTGENKAQVREALTGLQDKIGNRNMKTLFGVDYLDT